MNPKGDDPFKSMRGKKIIQASRQASKKDKCLRLTMPPASFLTPNTTFCYSLKSMLPPF